MGILGWMSILRSKRPPSTGLNSIQIHVHLDPPNVTFFRIRVSSSTRWSHLRLVDPKSNGIILTKRPHEDTEHRLPHDDGEMLFLQPRKVKDCQKTAMSWKKSLEYSPFLLSEGLIHWHLDFRFWLPERVNACCSKPPCRWWFVMTALKNESTSFLRPRALTTEPGRWSQLEIWVPP